MVLAVENEIDGGDDAYSGRDSCEASAGRCADLAGPARCGCGTSDRRDGSNLLSAEQRVPQPEGRSGKAVKDLEVENSRYRLIRLL